MWQRDRDVFLRLWRWLLIPNIAESVATMLALGFGVGSFVSGFGGTNYAHFIAPGLVCASAMWSAGFECSYGTFYRMEKQRTFDAIIATPVQIEDVVVGEIMYGAFRGFVSGTIVTLIFLAFGVFASPWALVLPLLCIAIGWMIGSLAVTAAAFAPALDTLSYFISFVLMPMFWLSGVFYKPSTFGDWAAIAQLFSPLYHAVAAAREFSMGHFSVQSIAHVGVTVAIAGAFSYGATYAMRRRLIR